MNLPKIDAGVKAAQKVLEKVSAIASAPGFQSIRFGNGAFKNKTMRVPTGHPTRQYRTETLSSCAVGIDKKVASFKGVKLIDWPKRRAFSANR